jgi:hypothetical protein
VTGAPLFSLFFPFPFSLFLFAGFAFATTCV